MIKIIEIYLKINYVAQRVLNKHNPKKGLIYMIGVQLTFVLSGIIIWLMVRLFGRINPMFGACFLGLFVLAFRNIFDSKFYKKIDFNLLNTFYINQSLKSKIMYTVLSIILFLFCLFLMALIPKSLTMLFRSQLN